MTVSVRPSLADEVGRLLRHEPDAIQDPYPTYRRMREESPLHQYDSKTLVLSRHRDVKAVYRDDRHFPATAVLGTRFHGQLDLLSDAERGLMDEFAEFERNTLSRKNGEDHARVRKAAHRYFTPRRTAELEPAFQGIFDDLLNERAGEDVFDFMTVAYRLPLLVIMELLGVPHEDADRVKAWGDTISLHQNPMLPAAVHMKKNALDEYREYTVELVSRHRRDPERTGLIASVLDAADGDRLSGDELTAFFLHTLFAGHETTQHMIGNGVLALLSHREQWQMLVEDSTLVPGAVEEILRWDTPAQMITKRAGADAEIDGISIAEGMQVLLLGGAANHDPEAFDGPDRFDVLRRPNDHLSLGHGVHFCLGASLARLEGRIVLSTLSRRFPEIDFAADPRTFRFRAGLRGLEQLPIRLGLDHG